MSKCIIPWTNAEDEAIIKVMSTLTKNESIGDAFKKLTKRLNRSNPAIQFRWYRVLKKQNISKPTKQSKSSIPDKNSSKEELLEYARKNYPVGTKIRGMLIPVERLITDYEFIINPEMYIIVGGNPGRTKVFDCIDNNWAEIISLPKQPTSTQEVKPKQKGVFLDVNKLESLSIQSLRELAVTKLVDIDKKKLIDLIVE